MTEKEIKNILDTVASPIDGSPLGQSGAVEGVSLSGKDLKFRLVMPGLDPEQKRAVRGVIEGEFGTLGYEVFVSIVEHPIEDLSRGAAAPPPQRQASDFIKPEIFARFKKIIAVHSAKGGVGKSTVSVGLAQALAAKGFRTLIIDLDLYGPSVPRMLGARGEVRIYNDHFVPMKKDGISMISVGNLVPDMESPLVWRAPIANGVVKQIFEDTLWEEDFDVCVIDMPPGTGDVPISVGQSIPLDGVVAVSTPQAVALEDTVKGISMFTKMGVPVLGLVKNMTSILCPTCGGEIPLYPNTGEFDAFLREKNVPVLGSLPLDTVVAAFADKGIMEALDQKSPWVQNMSKIASAVAEKAGVTKG